MSMLARLGIGAAVLGAVGVGAHFLHPRGLPGVAAELGVESVVAPPAAEPAVEAAARPADPQVEAAGPSRPVRSPLESAEVAFDEGDLSHAATQFLVARATAATDAERERAGRGMQVAVIGSELAATVTSRPEAALVSGFADRLAAAEAAPSEEAWLELFRVAVGAELTRELPYLAQRVADSARGGGPVERALQRRLPYAGTRAGPLREAMRNRGLSTFVPEEFASRTAPDPAGVEPSPSGSASGTAPRRESGIGGVSERGLPYGRFTAETRAKLREGVTLEGRGTAEYEQAGPSSDDRRRHREAALAALKRAREIYEEALREDPHASDLEERLHSITYMIAQLRKDQGVFER